MFRFTGRSLDVFGVRRALLLAAEVAVSIPATIMNSGLNVSATACV